MKYLLALVFVLGMSGAAMAQANGPQPCERGTGEAMDQARCTIFIQQQRIAQIQAQLDQMTVQYALTKSDLDVAQKHIADLTKKPESPKPQAKK